MLNQWLTGKYVLPHGEVLSMDKTTISIVPSQQALSAISCMGGLPDPEDAKQLRKVFRDFATQTKHTLMTVFHGDVQYIPASPKCRLERFIVWTPDHTAHAGTVWVMVSTGLVQYSFNPGEMSDDERIHFNALLEVTLPEGYVSLYRYGKVSMAEYAIDVNDVGISDVVLVDTGRRHYDLRKEGTMYGGCRRSKLVGVLYDKGEERRRWDPNFAGVQLRHEVRVRAPHTTLRQWVEDDAERNPFAPFIVVPRQALRDIVGKAKAEQIRNFGLAVVVRNKPARDSLIAALQQCRCAWGDPDLIWSSFRSKLIPGLRPPELQ